jgi:hypothetical protein
MAFILLDAQFNTGMLLGLTQALPGFNAATRGAITYKDSRLPGSFVNNVGFTLTQDLWTNRDPTSTAAAASGDRKTMGQINQIGVKRPIKAIVENRLTDFAASIGAQVPKSSEEFSQMIGEWVARTKLLRQFNDALLAARVAIKNQAANTATATANSGKANSGDLNLARAKMGDLDFAAAGVLIMHSKPFYDLVGNQVAEKIPDVAGFNLFRGLPATYGIPTLVTDSAALVGVRGSGSAAVPEYYSLGLLPGGVNVTNDAAETVVADAVTGGENILYRLQAEGAHVVDVKGFKWDTSNGGANPSDAAFATATNWDPTESGTGAEKRRAGFCWVTL